MGVIDARSLVRAMDRTPITASRLADEVGISLAYMCDITAGRRTLKRNPALRRRIAEVLDVPQHWIEAHPESDGARDDGGLR